MLSLAGAGCAGDLTQSAGESEGAVVGAPTFQAPFPCGQSWTYTHHVGEVRRALDFINNSGATDGSPVLATAAGTATQHSEPAGAGNYIAIDHGGGWTTYYFHLQAFSVGSGAVVRRGEQVGLVGATGNVTGPHLNYEQLLNGAGQDIILDGAPLTPYPSTYGVASVTSANCGDRPSSTETGPAFVVGNQQHVFAAGADGSLRHRFWDGNAGQVLRDSWDAGVAGTPTTFVAGAQQHVFARTPSGELGHWFWDGSQIGHDVWGSGLAGDPAAALIGAQQHAWAVDSGGALQHFAWDPTSGMSHETWGAGVTGRPAVLLFGLKQHVFTRGTGGSLEHSSGIRARRSCTTCGATA